MSTSSSLSNTAWWTSLSLLPVALKKTSSRLSFLVAPWPANAEYATQHIYPLLLPTCTNAAAANPAVSQASCTQYMCTLHDLCDQGGLMHMACCMGTANQITTDIAKLCCAKCLAPTYMGDFAQNGSMLRQKGINRIGNMLIPNNNYCKFEDWLMPILSAMHREQTDSGVRWTPSKVRCLPLLSCCAHPRPTNKIMKDTWDVACCGNRLELRLH